MSNTTRKPAAAARAAAATKTAKPDADPAGAADGGEDKGAAGGKAMNRVDLISAVAAEVDLPKNKAGEAVDAVFGAIQAALKQGQEVRLAGFGTFATANRKATTGRNPRTGEQIQIGESTSVRFKAGKSLKDAVG